MWACAGQSADWTQWPEAIREHFGVAATGAARPAVGKVQVLDPKAVREQAATFDVAVMVDAYEALSPEWRAGSK